MPPPDTDRVPAEQESCESGKASASQETRDSGKVLTEVTASWSGPLPPPSMLKGYDAILPGAANRILSSYERQSAHRQRLEAESLASDNRRRLLGMLSSNLMFLGLIGIALTALVLGHAWVAATVGGFGGAALLTPFLRAVQNIITRNSG